MVTNTTFANGIYFFCLVTMLANAKAADELQYTLHNVFECTCAIGWVDIGTVARIALNVVLYLKKVGKMT
jgi:hypothetical protein